MVEQAGAPPKNYPLRGAVIFIIAYTLFFIFVVVWGFERSMFIARGGHFILYLLQLPGAEFAELIGVADDLSDFAPYAVAYFVNVILYAALGYGVGYLFQKKGWIQETDDVFLTEEEIEWKKMQSSQ